MAVLLALDHTGVGHALVAHGLGEGRVVLAGEVDFVVEGRRGHAVVALLVRFVLAVFLTFV